METNNNHMPEQSETFVSEATAVQGALPEAPEALPPNKVLHWGSIYTLITIIYFSVFAMMGLLLPLETTIPVDTNQSAQDVFTVMFLLMLLLCPHSILFISLTYKRFSYSKPWKLFTLLDILATPVFITIIFAPELSQSIENTLLTAVPGFSSYIMLAIVIMLIQLGFYLWALWKEHKKPKSTQVKWDVKPQASPKKGGKGWTASLVAADVKPLVRSKQSGMHWAVAALIAYVVSFLIRGILSLPNWWTSAFQNAENSAMEQTAVLISFVIVSCPRILGFFLWIRLTWKRYAASVNWQWCSIAVYIYFILSAFGSLSFTFENLIIEQFIAISATLPTTIPATYYVVSVLGFLLPMLYFWRIIQKKKPCSCCAVCRILSGVNDSLPVFV